MKIKRSKIKKWGGGSGQTTFESPFFNVSLMRMVAGNRTKIKIKYTNKKLTFDGLIDFKSDKACFEQLTISELKDLIKGHRKQAFRAGRNNKIEEIKKVFEYEY